MAKAGSFRQGTASLGVSPSSASHIVRRLEERLGIRLLHRSTRSAMPTLAGAALLDQVDALLGQIDDLFAEATARTDQVTGALTISAATLAVRHLLREIVPRFRERHPAADLELRIEDRIVDIVADGCDAGIRLRYAVPADMVAVPIGDAVWFVVVATPAYLDGAGRPQTPNDLLAHDCIRIRLPSGALFPWEFERNGRQHAVRVSGRLVLNRAELMVEAALGGTGFAYVFEDLARDALADGRLVTVLDEWCHPKPGLTLYYPGHRKPPPVLRAFIDLLRASGSRFEIS